MDFGRGLILWLLGVPLPILLLLALFGPGRLSLDELILKRLGLRPASVA